MSPLFLFENDNECRAFFMLMVKFLLCSILYSSHVNVWALKSHGIPVVVVTK